jgi:uncharacterized protein YjdB
VPFRVKPVKTSTTAQGGAHGILALGTTVGLVRNATLSISKILVGGWGVEIIRVIDGTHVQARWADDGDLTDGQKRNRFDLTDIPTGCEVLMPQQYVEGVYSDDMPDSLAAPYPVKPPPPGFVLTPGPTVVLDGIGATQQMTAIADYGGGHTLDITDRAVWSSSNPADLSVSSTGLVTALADPGTGDIEAAFETYTHSTSFTVKSLVSIAVTPAAPLLTGVGATQQMTATGTYSDASTADLTATVTWASATPAKATVSAGGLVTAVAAGTSVISATLGAISGNTTVSVKTLVSIAVTPAAPLLTGVGATQQMTATGTYSDASVEDLTATVTWDSATPATATVTVGGLVTAVAAGTSVISATLGAIFGNTTVSVKTLVSIAVTPATPTINTGDTQQMTATGTYSDASTADLTNVVTWSSGTPANLTVSATGLVTGVADGTSVITATLGAISGNTTATDVTPAAFLLDDTDAGIVSHVYFDGAQLVDTKGNAWVKVGNPTFLASTAMGNPNGDSAFRAGGFTNADYFKLGAGADIFDFGAVGGGLHDLTFTITFIVKQNGAGANRGFFANGQTGVIGYFFYNSAGTARMANGGFGSNVDAGAFTGGYDVISWGRDAAAAGGKWFYKLNGNAAVHSANADQLFGTLDTVIAYLGKGDNADGSQQPWDNGGELVEMRATSTAPSTAALDAIHAALGY